MTDNGKGWDCKGVMISKGVKGNNKVEVMGEAMMPWKGVKESKGESGNKDVNNGK